MFFYIILFVLIILLGITCPRNKTIGTLGMGLLCFFSMFRGERVGTDTATYMDIHRMVLLYEYDYGGGILSKNWEFISSTLYNVIYNNSLSPRLAIVFFSLLTFIFLFLSLKRTKLSYGIGCIIFLILFYLSSFNIARQICACSIVLYACTFLFEKSNKKYLFFVYVFLASFIHAVSLIFVAVYLVRFIREVPYKRTTLTVVAGIIFLFNLVSPINLSELLTTLLGDVSYAEIYSDRAITTSRSFMGIMQDFAKFLVAILVLNYGGIAKKVTLPDLLFYLSIIAAIFSANAHSDIARIFLPIDFFQILYFPYIYQYNRKFIHSLPFFSFIFIHAFFTLWGAAMGSGEVVPYVLDVSL